MPQAHDRAGEPPTLSSGWTHGRTLPHPSSSRFRQPGHDLPSLAALLCEPDADARAHARAQQRFQNLQDMHQLMDAVCPHFMMAVWPAVAETPLGEQLLESYHLLGGAGQDNGNAREHALGSAALAALEDKAIAVLLGMRVRKVFVARFLRREPSSISVCPRAHKGECAAGKACV
ncbi:hypothetical protein ESCO_005626 [Escovopsis weberi]|uniref:Uncharacterized protein n=1 Tax=Escovopsis weberi TaxID=150374 RepID=A0A0M8MZG8_ESCWE|nr:hypothetical protein ESCO_005626 [Escovopsis weberi]